MNSQGQSSMPTKVGIQYQSVGVGWPVAPITHRARQALHQQQHPHGNRLLQQGKDADTRMQLYREIDRHGQAQRMLAKHRPRRDVQHQPALQAQNTPTRVGSARAQ